MIGWLIGLGLLTLVLWVAYKIVGTLFKACVWLFIRVPIGICTLIIGVILCITILLFPVGKWFLKVGISLILP